MQENLHKKGKNDLVSFEYKYKIRTAIIAGFLFMLLSNKNAYKILDIILNIFTNKINIFSDEDCSPHIIGIIIMSFIIAIIVFMV